MGHDLEVLVCTDDCLMLRESPGRIPFTKLVTIEVWLDGARSVNNAIPMEVVVTNEELPLHSNNHCYEIFTQLSQVLNDE